MNVKGGKEGGDDCSVSGSYLKIPVSSPVITLDKKAASSEVI
jgi:hypothetical protein